jgi:Flp pilus assembly secretin CpaC
MRYKKSALLPLLSSVFTAALSLACFAQEARNVVLARGEAVVMRLDTTYANAFVESPRIADVFPLSDQSFRIIGRKAGTARIRFTDENNSPVAMIEIEVTNGYGKMVHPPR